MSRVTSTIEKLLTNCRELLSTGRLQLTTTHDQLDSLYTAIFDDIESIPQPEQQGELNYSVAQHTNHTLKQSRTQGPGQIQEQLSHMIKNFQNISKQSNKSSPLKYFGHNRKAQLPSSGRLSPIRKFSTLPGNKLQFSQPGYRNVTSQESFGVGHEKADRFKRLSRSQEGALASFVGRKV